MSSTKLKSKKSVPEPSLSSTISSGQPEGLLACVQVRCVGNKLHKVGLAPGGQLILFDHTKDDMKRMLAVEDLGGMPSRCAYLMAGWQANVCTAERNTFPVILGRERILTGGMSGRLLRRLRRQRHADWSCTWPEQDLKPNMEADELKSSANYAWSLNSLRSNWACTQLLGVLGQRGHNRDNFQVNGGNLYDKHKVPNADDPTKMEEELSLLVGFDWNGHGYMEMRSHSSGFAASFSKLEDLPLRLAADLAELEIMRCRTEMARSRNKDRSKNEFQRLAELLKNKIPIDGKLNIRSDHALVDLMIDHRHLTLAAASILMEAYNSLSIRVRAILMANKSRCCAPHRHPQPAGPGLRLEKIKVDKTPPNTQSIAPLYSYGYHQNPYNLLHGNEMPSENKDEEGDA